MKGKIKVRKRRKEERKEWERKEGRRRGKEVRIRERKGTFADGKSSLTKDTH